MSIIIQISIFPKLVSRQVFFFLQKGTGTRVYQWHNGGRQNYERALILYFTSGKTYSSGSTNFNAFIKTLVHRITVVCF